MPFPPIPSTQVVAVVDHDRLTTIAQDLHNIATEITTAASTNDLPVLRVLRDLLDERTDAFALVVDTMRRR